MIMERFERDVLTVMLDAVWDETVTFVASTEEYTKRVMDEVERRIGSVQRNDGCRHTEHAVRAGVGRVGRYFESMNDQTGTWEPCPDGYHPAGAWDDIPATVCVVHLRFVPCRRDEPESRCHISTDPKQVTVVRDYQMSKLSESFAHAALDRLQQFDGGRDEL